MRLGSFVLGATALLAPAVAQAGNGLHPRTPVVWNGVECRGMHDRTSAATWHVEYDIPYEDTEVTVDEVADSRRHQFFALCRDNSPQDFLPNWITWADVMAAGDAGLVDPATITDEQVLETNADWSSCFQRINADDARLPITTENAAAGVAWDTAAVDPGGYTLFGYTWEPPFNLWVQRPGFVKVYDGDPDAVAPAIAITTGEQVLYKNGSGIIEGCVDALQGSTLAAYWAIAQDDPEWISFVEDEPVAGESFAIEFDAPEGLVGESGMLRVDITDPMGRTTTAYGIELVIVLPTDDPGSCGDGGGFVADPGCEDTGGSAESTGGGATDDGGIVTGTSGDAGSTTDPMADGGDADGDGGGKGGCACSTAPAPVPLGGAALLVLGLFGLRRRLG